MTRISIAEARGEMSEVVNRLIYKGEQFALTRHGKTVGVILPVEVARSLGLKVDEKGSVSRNAKKTPNR
jgi:antitoxin (DNA-binding transcriptional repressor) of toxin-antitoxin stability system